MFEITCILPVAGIGKRLQPHTFTMPKVLLTVAGKPILGHLLEFLKGLGVNKIVFITGHLGEKVIKYVKSDFPELNSVFVEQKKFLGLGYAVYMAREHVSGPVLINLGDTLIEADVKKYIAAGKSWVGVKKVEDPRRFGVAVTDKSGVIKKVVEKPEKFVSDQAICGIYYFSDSSLLFESLGEIIKKEIKTANEYQLTDAIEKMIEKGNAVYAREVDGWFDSGKVETLLLTNRHLLEKNKPVNVPIPSVVINPPVYIAPGARLCNCVVGPYVSVGREVDMVNVIVQNSIINDGANVKNVVLKNSVIGYSASLTGNLQTINLSDVSTVNLTGEDNS